MPDAKKMIERGIRLERGGVVDEALRVYMEAETAAEDEATRSEALRRQADALRVRCEWDTSIERAMLAERVARAANLQDHAAEALNARAAIAQSRGDLEGAAVLYTDALALARNGRIRGVALQNLGALAAMAGDHDEAAGYFEGSLECFRESGYERGIAIALNNVGRASLDRGDAARAEEVLAPAVTQARQLEDLELASLALVNYAEALLARGELEQGEEEVSAALGFFKVSGNLWRQIECLRLLGDLRRARGEVDVATRLYEQALMLADRIGSHREADDVRRRLTDVAPQLP